MYFRKANFAAGMFLLKMAAASCLVLLGQSVGAQPPQLPSDDVLDTLRKSTPTQRMARLSKFFNKSTDVVSVTPGRVTLVHFARGAIYPLDSGTIVCELKETTTIKWLVEDGETVKKGDKLILFDDGLLQDKLTDQEFVVFQAAMAERIAEEKASRLPKENQLSVQMAEIDVKTAEVEVRLADLALKRVRAIGNPKDAPEETLRLRLVELKLDHTRLALQRLKMRCQGEEETAKSDLTVKAMIKRREVERLADIKEEIKKCTILAHRDGYVVNYSTLLKQGSKVVEGEKLLMLPNPKNMIVSVLIPEADVDRIKATQEAHIRLDGLANPTLPGYVWRVASAFQLDGKKPGKWFRADVKIAEDSSKYGITPRMSASVAIVIDEAPRRDCLRVPASAILQAGDKKYCYVLADDKLHERIVETGFAGSELIEILKGLERGEQVLADPRAAMDRLVKQPKK